MRTAVLIVDDPREFPTPRVGQRERKATFVCLASDTRQGDAELEDGPVGGQGEHTAAWAEGG